MSIFSPISLFLVCRQRSSQIEQPDFPRGLLNYTKTPSGNTNSKYMTLFRAHLKWLITCVFWLSFSHIPFLLVKLDPARPTIAHTMHVSREPQDDGYTQIPRAEESVAEMNQSDLSQTFDSSSDTPKSKKTPREVRSQKPTPFRLDRANKSDTLCTNKECIYTVFLPNCQQLKD